MPKEKIENGIKEKNDITAAVKLPYVLATSRIRPIMDSIKKASVPTRFTNDFLSTKLGYKSTNDRAAISLLKKLDFLTPDGAPTAKYKAFRHETDGPLILGEAIKMAFRPLFEANEYAQQLDRAEVEQHIKRITGLGADSQVLRSTTATFDELCKLAKFDGVAANKPIETTEKAEIPGSKGNHASSPLPDSEHHLPKRLGLSYTVNLNLPPTTDVEVFNAIFKSLKEHLLND